MSNREQISHLSLDVHRLLSEYVAVHDDVFKASVRRVIPLPLIFRAIEWGKHVSAIEAIAEDLDRCTDRAEYLAILSTADQRAYLDSLSQYLRALIATVALFKAVLDGMHAKAQSWRSYKWRTYRHDITKYKQSISVYIALGNGLGDKLRNLPWSLNRSEDE